MVATSDFSGLISSICALARAAASAPMDSLARCCIGILVIQHIEVDGAGFRALGSEAIANGLLCICWHEAPELSLGAFVFVMCGARSDENCGQFGPRIR